jgi:muramoyltetrapeptide carboxypeptidase
METLKPPRLKSGDLIGLICPAGPLTDPGQLERGVRYLETQGYRTAVGRHALKIHGFLAGTDEDRLADLHAMFAHHEIKAILCVRGGYGTSRLLPRVDYSLVARHPKILVGFSDITALQLALWKKCRLVTFHGPMLRADLTGPVDPFTEEAFWEILTSPCQPPPRAFAEAEWTLRYPGSATGRLLGGNLSLVISLLGTPFAPDFRRALLILEDVAEEPYRIDRMFVQLANAGILQRVSGILTNAFNHCQPRNPGRPSFRVEEVLAEQACLWQKPFVTGLPFGHVARKFTWPIGIRARIDATHRRLALLESAVRA